MNYFPINERINLCYLNKYQIINNLCYLSFEFFFSLFKKHIEKTIQKKKKKEKRTTFEKSFLQNRHFQVIEFT